MKGDIDLRDIQWSKLGGARRVRTLLIAGFVLVGALALGWRWLTHPPQPWLVRWKLDRYLKKESHASTFRVDFAFPSKAEMAKPKDKAAESKVPTGPRTGKTFEVLREEYLGQKTAAVALERTVVRTEQELKEGAARLQALTNQIAAGGAEVSNLESNAAALREKLSALAQTPSRRAEWQQKEQALAPVEDDLWELQKQQGAAAAVSDAAAQATLAKARAQFTEESERSLRASTSYDAMYKIIGQELFVAKGLLASGNPEHRRQGVSAALSAARHASEFAVNGGVAARIVEGYVLPNLDLANDTNRRSLFNEENLLGQCANIFERNFEYNNVVRTYETYLATTKNTARADWARERIGDAYENAGDLKNALRSYRKIQNTNNFRNLFQRQIPRLERQLRG
jgi:hypothetical protein